MSKVWTREERYRVLKDPGEVRSLHESITKSPWRQLCHIQPVTGLLNDPNGFVYHDGLWHLFYQWCPWGAVHGLKYWYHVTSKDLVTWKNEGVCIRPDTVWDNRGAYSGSALTEPGSLYLYYTGNHRDEDWTRKSYTCLVKLSDDGTAVKAAEPLFGPNPDYTEHQRDPKIVRNEKNGKYYIFLGAQTKDLHGCILVYISDSPTSGWSFAGQLKVPGFEAFGDMWECPSVEHIQDTDVLLFCPQHLTLVGRGHAQNHNGYLLGHMDYDTLTFTPLGRFHVLDRGFDSYAAECAATAESHRKEAVLVAWMGLPDAAYPSDDEGWANCLTLPRVLRMRGRRLIQTPIPELVSLRGEKVPDGADVLPDACDIELACGGEEMSLSLFAGPDGEGGFRILWDPNKRLITVDRSHMKNRFNKEDGEIRQRPLENGLQYLRIFLDRSSIEIFANDGDAVFTSRVFPEKDEHHVVLSGDAELSAWQMRPAVQDDFVI